MTINEVLRRVHIRYEQNTGYPESSSEDYLIRLALANDAITLWEKDAREGVLWDILRSEASIAATGTGTDTLPDDFFCFAQSKEATIALSGTDTAWTLVSAEDGRKNEYSNNTGAYVFWVEGGNIRSLPAWSGTVRFPYIRTATRYETGAETDAIETPEMLLEEYILAQLYLMDNNVMAYNSHMQNALDILSSAKSVVIGAPAPESNFEPGM